MSFTRLAKGAIVCFLVTILIVLAIKGIPQERPLPLAEPCVLPDNGVNVAFVIIASPRGTNAFYDFCYDAWVKFSNKHRCKCIFLFCSQEVGHQGQMKPLDTSSFATNYYARCSELYSDIYTKTAFFVHEHLNNYLADTEWIIRTNLTTTWNYCKLINTLTLESQSSRGGGPIFLHDHNYTLSGHIRHPKCPLGYALVMNRGAWQCIHADLLPCISSQCSHTLLESLDMDPHVYASLWDGKALQDIESEDLPRLVDDQLIPLLLYSKGIAAQPGFHLMLVETRNYDIQAARNFDVIRIKYPGQVHELIETRSRIDKVIDM